jgi:cytochrome c-type biogenesis protein CcmH/NrfF
VTKYTLHYTTLLFYNLPVYVVLCNCSVLSVVSVKNEHYKKDQKNKQKKTKKCTLHASA